MANSELKPSKNGRLRNFLFGKKKRHHSKKRVACNCCASAQGTKKDEMVRTNNICTDNKEEEKLPILNVNAYGDPKKSQKNGECPGKVFPLERRGCGFHLYFCIDNAGKSNIARNKIKKLKYENNKVNNCLEVDKGVSCVSEAESVAETIRSHQSYSPKYRKNTTNMYNMYLDSKAKENSPTETPSLTQVHLPESAAKKSKESDLPKPIDSSPRNQEEKGNSILRTRRTSSHTVMVNNAQEEKTNMFLPPPLSFRETSIFYTEMEPPKKRVQSVRSEDAIYADYEALQKTIRRSTVKSRGTLARNSMMSLRKKRFSFVDNMVPEILSKLDHIEEKLTELEKVYEDKGKNITNIVGVSCNCVKSAVDLRNLDGNLELNKKPCCDTKPSEFASYRVQPVLIKSCGEDVIVNAPESVSVVKKMRNKQESRQLVYHNTRELDAHNITSKSFSKTNDVKSQNQVISARPSDNSKKPNSSMWRKISEELKF